MLIGNVFVERTFPSGYVEVSAFVTDGVDTWLESQRFSGYPRKAAISLFKRDLREKKLTIVKDV